MKASSSRAEAEPILGSCAARDLLLLVFLSATAAVFSQEETPKQAELFDEETLFQEEAFIEELDTSEESQAPTKEFLTSEGTTWGGTFTGELQAGGSWNNLGTEDFDFLDPPDRTLDPTVKTTLFFSSRPAEDFRVFGKLSISSSSSLLGDFDLASLTEDLVITVNDDGTFSIGTREDGDDGEDGGNDEEEEEYEPGTGTNPTLTIGVTELFADFSFKDSLFFRFGKQTIKWGVGYFFSPADVLNLTAIDVEDPTAERTGPVALKINHPFGFNNAHLYIVTNEGIRPSEAALAPKLDFLSGTTEISLAAYYQRSLAPRFIGMFSSASGNWDFFGEAVLSVGSDRVYVRRSKDQSAAEEDGEDGLEIVLDTYTIDTLPIFSATLGFMYIDGDTNWTIIGQYFFNGEGYADSSLLAAAYRLLNNADENGLAISDTDARPEGYEAPPALSTADLSPFGQHYAALSIVKRELFVEDLSLALFGYMNLNDLSGIVSLSVSWELFDKLTVSGMVRATFGGPGDELTDPTARMSGETEVFPTLGFTLSASLGSGSF